MSRTYSLCSSLAEAQRIAQAADMWIATVLVSDGWYFAWSRGNFSGSACPKVLRTHCWAKGRKAHVVEELIAELGYRSAEVVDIACDRVGCRERSVSPQILAPLLAGNTENGRSAP
jgi:hypothetical protein